MSTSTVPLGVLATAMLSIAPIPFLTPVAGTPLIGGYMTIGYLAKLPFQHGSKGIRSLATSLQANVTSRCQVTDDPRDLARKVPQQRQGTP